MRHPPQPHILGQCTVGGIFGQWWTTGTHFPKTPFHSRDQTKATVTNTKRSRSVGYLIRRSDGNGYRRKGEKSTFQKSTSYRAPLASVSRTMLISTPSS